MEVVLGLANGSVERVPVVDGAVAKRGFRFRFDIVSVTIPEGVTRIGDDAFFGCSSLVSVTIPDGVTAIGAWAFQGCSSLVSVTIPDGVTAIGAGAFMNCRSLASVTIPAAVSRIHVRAFDGCTSLASVTIPDGVTLIGESAFARCSSLVSVVVAEASVDAKKLGEIFEGCTQLALVVGPAATISRLPRIELADINNGALRTPGSLGLEFSAAAVGLVERWDRRTHILSTRNQRDWVRFALLALIRRLGLPRPAAIIVLQSLQRSELGDGRAIEF